MSSLTLSCFDRQHTCILVRSLVSDDRSAPHAAHTRQPEKGSSFGAQFQDFEQPADRLPGGPDGWIKERLGPRRCRAHMANSSGPSHFWDGAFFYLRKIINKKKKKKKLLIRLLFSFLYSYTCGVLRNLFFRPRDQKKLKKAHCAIFQVQRIRERLSWMSA